MVKDLQPVFLNGAGKNSIFQIPSHLVKSCGPVLPSEATLRVDDSGEEWRVAIEKFKGHYFFTDGWKEFAERVDLKSLGFLVFKSGSSSKQKASCTQNENKGMFSSVDTEKSFSRELKKHHRYGMEIPRKFISRVVKYAKIRLKDGEGKEWPIHVVRKGTGRLCMRGGWTEFLIGNKVMLGSTLSFTWLSENMLETEVLDVGAEKKLLFSTAKHSICARGNHLQDPDS